MEFCTNVFFNQPVLNRFSERFFEHFVMHGCVYYDIRCRHGLTGN